MMVLQMADKFGESYRQLGSMSVAEIDVGQVVRCSRTMKSGKIVQVNDVETKLKTVEIEWTANCGPLPMHNNSKSLIGTGLVLGTPNKSIQHERMYLTPASSRRFFSCCALNFAGMNDKRSLQNDELIDDERLEAPSKSAKKREMLALQALGQELATLSEKQFQKIQFPEDALREALENGKLKFTPKEWNAFKIKDITANSVVRATDSTYAPRLTSHSQ